MTDDTLTAQKSQPPFGSPADPNYAPRKLTRPGAEVEPLAGGIEAEPAPRGTDVVSALAWLDAGTEVEPAVGGMSLQSQPMPGSHPLLGQRPLPGQQHYAAVWPALEALSFDTQFLIMKFAYSGEFAFQAEDEQR